MRLVLTKILHDSSESIKSRITDLFDIFALNLKEAIRDENKYRLMVLEKKMYLEDCNHIVKGRFKIDALIFFIAIDIEYVYQSIEFYKKNILDPLANIIIQEKLFLSFPAHELVTEGTIKLNSIQCEDSRIVTQDDGIWSQEIFPDFIILTNLKTEKTIIVNSKFDYTKNDIFGNKGSIIIYEI